MARATESIGGRTPRRVFSTSRTLGGLVAVAVLLVFGLVLRADGATSVTVQIAEPGRSGSVPKLDLSSFSAARASLNNANRISIEWPGATGLGTKSLGNSQVTVDTDVQAITVNGSVSVQGATYQAILVADWEPGSNTPVLAFGLGGDVDLSILNPNWKAASGALKVEGSVVVTTADIDLDATAAGKAFFGEGEPASAGISVQGNVALSRHLPGLTANSAKVAVSGEFSGDVVALLTNRPLLPTDQSDVRLTGQFGATGIRGLTGADGIKSTEFTLVVGLEGIGGDASMSVEAVGAITINHPRLAAGDVVFEMVARADGSTTSFEGGLASGSSWKAPLGQTSVEVASARADFTFNSDGTFSGGFSTEVTLEGARAKLAMSTDGSNLSVDLELPPINVGQVADMLKKAGINTGSVHADVRRLGVGATELHFTTDGPNIEGTLVTGVNFANAGARLLVSGNTASANSFVLAFKADGASLGDYFNAGLLSDMPVPEGAVVISQRDITQATYPAGSPERTFFADVMCAANNQNCSFSIARGVTIAGQMTLPETVRSALSAMGPAGTDGNLQFTGTIPAFGGSGLDIRIKLPTIDRNANSPEWFKQAQLETTISNRGGVTSFGLVGRLTTVMPDEGTKADTVTFQIDGAVSLDPTGASITIGGGLAPGTGWTTPFGIDWLDLQALRLEMTINVGPKPSAQAGVRAKAKIGPSTFDVSAAVEVAAGRLGAGVRIQADVIGLRDVVALGARVAGTNFDATTLPDAALRNVELSVSTLDAPNLCLETGIKIAADLYLNASKTSAGSGAEQPIDSCGGSELTPQQQNQRCLADSACFAHMSFELGEDGIEASAALNEVDLGAVVVSNAALALDVSTSAPPSFALSGDLEIPGFATATGSVELSASGFSFMVQVAEADDPAGDMVTISASAGFGTNGQPPSFKATLFVRLPSVDEVFRDVQDAYSDVQQFFTGSPTTHELSLRCLEVNVDLRVGMSSPLSGSVNAKVHLGWINKQNTFDSQGKVWQIGWNFDASLFDNGSNLLDSLSGATVPDTTGCRIPPSSFDIGQLARTVDDPYLFVTRPDGGTVAYQEYGERIWMRLGITLSDPAVYEVLMKTSTGLVLPPQEIRHTRIGPSSYSINVPAEWRIRESDVAPDTDGYGHASITAEIRVKGTTRVIAEDSQPLVLLDAGIVDHRIGGVPTRAEHQDQFVPVAWRQPFDMLRGGSVKSWFTLDDGFGPEKIPGTETNVSIPRVFSATEWLNRPLQTGGYAWLDIRAGGAVSPTQVLTHHLEYTNDSGQKQTSSTQLVVTVSDPTPQVSMVCVDVTCKTFATPVRPANRAGGIYTPRFLVAEPGQTLSVYVYDPGATVGNASTRESYNVSAAGQTKTISRQSGQEPASFPGAQVDFTLPAGLARGQTHVMKIAVACDGNGCPGSNTVEVSIVVPANRSVAAFTDAADGVSGPYSTATAFTGTPHPTTACGAVGFATGTALGPNSDIVQVRVVGAKRAEDGATVPMRIEGDGVTFTNGVATMLVTPGGSSVFRVYEDRPTAISDADCRFQAARFTSTFDLEVTRYPGPIPNDSYDQQKRLAFWDTANGGIDESTDVVDLAEASIDSFEQSNTPSCWTDGAQHTAFYWTSSLNVDNLRLLVSAVSLEGADLQVAVFEAPPPSPGKLEPVTREIGCSNSASQAMTLADAGPYGAQSADVVVKATSMMVIVVDTQGDPGPAMIRVRQLVAEPIAVTGTSAVVRTDTGLGVNDVAAIAECGTGSTAGAVTWTAPFTSTITIGASGGAASSALGVSRVGSDAFSFGWPTKNLSGFDPLGCVASVTSAPQQNRQVSVVEGQTYMFTVVSPPGSPAMTLTFTETGERFIKGKFVDLQGYWMVDETGYVYAFGDSETVVPTGTRATVTSRAVKVLENPSGAGIWILESNGVVHALGGAPHYGNVNLAQLSNGEVPSTMAATPGGLGYYVFTSKGRALTFGNATHFGDLVTIGLADALRGPVVDSASLQDGRGYYMVGSDGGIFTFGDAVFAGSVPQVVPGPLDSPVNGLVVDPDGSGYWLVAGDGGVFAFDAPFRGSIPGVLPPGTKLNQPINGMVPYGNGYLMVAGDGGIFNFSNLAFLGSLGDRQIPSPIVAVAPVPR